MKALPFVTAVIESSAGLALLACPSLAATLLLGAPLETPAALTVARVAGTGLLALGVGCGFAAGDPQSRAARGLVAAMTIYNVATAGVLAFAGIGFAMHGALLWPAVILHAAMAIWCIKFLRSKIRKPKRP